MSKKSCCPKCGNTSFELALNSPKGSNYKINLVQCDSCGAVVGTMEYTSVGYLVTSLAKKMGFTL